MYTHAHLRFLLINSICHSVSLFSLSFYIFLEFCRILCHYFSKDSNSLSVFLSEMPFSQKLILLLLSSLSLFPFLMCLGQFLAWFYVFHLSVLLLSLFIEFFISTIIFLCKKNCLVLLSHCLFPPHILSIFSLSNGTYYAYWVFKFCFPWHRLSKGRTYFCLLPLLSCYSTTLLHFWRQVCRFSTHQAVLWLQLCILQFNSILILSSWR